MYKIEDLTKDINLKLMKHYKLLSNFRGLTFGHVYGVEGWTDKIEETSINLLIFNYLLIHQGHIDFSVVWDNVEYQDRCDEKTIIVELINDWVNWGSTDYAEEFRALYETLSRIPKETLKTISSSIIKTVRSTLKTSLTFTPTLKEL